MVRPLPIKNLPYSPRIPLSLHSMHPEFVMFEINDKNLSFISEGGLPVIAIDFVFDHRIKWGSIGL